MCLADHPRAWTIGAVLPFLTKTTVFLYPCLAVGSLYIVGLVTR
jgi:hypothetical protein